jgi:hypothetical protein
MRERQCAKRDIGRCDPEFARTRLFAGSFVVRGRTRGLRLRHGLQDPGQMQVVLLASHAGQRLDDDLADAIVMNVDGIIGLDSKPKVGRTFPSVFI